MTSLDLDQLDSGAQYEVQVMAIVQNSEGSPVSVRIITRESHFSYRFQLLSQVHNKLRKQVDVLYCDFHLLFRRFF